MSQEQQEQPQDINTLVEELNALKLAYTDLEGRYNQLDNTHKEYKLDIEFQRDISDIYKPIGDEEKDTLRALKASGNDKAYNLLLNSFKTTPDNTGGLGNYSRGFNPSREIKIQQDDNSDFFTESIKELKGGL